MTFTNLRLYVRERRIMRRANILIERRGLPIVAYAMFRLNRTAQLMSRYEPRKRMIYELKNMLVRNLYERGFCVGVRKQSQKLVCRNCGGSGWDEWHDVECYHCEGTGIYRTIALYLFRFRIGDRTFSWHQPAALVDFEVKLTDADDTMYEPDVNKKVVPLEGERSILMFAVVMSYLLSQRIAVPQRTLGTSLYLDFIARPLHKLELKSARTRRTLDDFRFAARLKLAIWLRRDSDYERDPDDYSYWGEAPMMQEPDDYPF